MRVILITALLLTASPAYAEPFIYKNPLCPIEVTLPEKPEIKQNCISANTKDCHDIATFRSIEALDRSLDIKIACQKDNSKKMPEDKAMVQSLQILLTDSRMREYSGEVIQHGPIKQAIFMGLRSEKDQTPSTVIGNLWMGKGWRYTIIAEHVGIGSDTLEKMFFSVIKSQRLTAPVKAD